MSRDALVVGINRYTDSHLANLTAPAEDAEAIARVLEEYGDFRVGRYPEAIHPETRKSYVGRELNLCLADLEDALIKLFNPQDRAVPDTALFYFSGHGLRRSLGGISEGFLATSDADSTRRFYGLSLQWLRRLLQESPIKQQIVWLDCCYSGELLNVQEADPGEKGQARDRCFIAASRGFEVAYQDISEPYSVLTKELLAGLDPARHPQRWVTNYSLIDHLDRMLGQEATQRPIFSNFGEPINLTRSWEVAVETETKPEVGDPTICPYKGLEFFDNNEEDPKYFFGREELTDKLLDHLRTGNFLALVGASGSGKSSVLRAGLLHQLQQGRKLSGSQDWVIRCFTPGENGQSPLQNLAEAFVGNQLSPVEYAEQLETAEKQLATGADGLRRLVQGLKAPRVVLAIDQFEEIFTLCQDKQEREQFFACLMGALEQLQEKLAVVVTMRADFLGRCVEQDYSGLAQRIQDTVPVTPMSREQLGDAILKPAERVNLKLEPALVERMLSDVAEAPGTLPLLQYALKQLWQQNPKQLRLEDYIQLGHIGGSLNQRATELFNTMSPTQQAATKRIFLCLTQLGEGTEDTRRRALKRDMITPLHPESVIDEALQVLTNKDNRLIVTSQLQEKGTGRGEVVVDVAHEAVIRHWQLLRKWLSENRDKLREQRRLEAAAQEWDRERRNNRRKAGDYLLQGTRLQQANQFRKKEQQSFPLSSTASDFLQKSNRKRQINYAAILFSLGLLVIAVGLIYREIDITNNWEIIKTRASEKNALESLNYWKQSLRNIILENANLDYVNLLKADLGEANLRKANLREANLGEANLKRANLEGANLEGANLEGANLEGANQEGANLVKASLWEANLREANLEGANLEGANLVKANLVKANLVKASLWEANLGEANLREANLVGANLVGANLGGADLGGANLGGADLEGADLGRVYLEEVYLGRANLERANLVQAIYTDSSTDAAVCERLYSEFPCPTKFPKDFNPAAEEMKQIRTVEDLEEALKPKVNQPSW